MVPETTPHTLKVHPAEGGLSNSTAKVAWDPAVILESMAASLTIPWVMKVIRLCQSFSTQTKGFGVYLLVQNIHHWESTNPPKSDWDVVYI